MLRVNTGMGGSAGSAPTTGNSGGASGDAWSSVTQTDITYSASAARFGGLGYRITLGVTSHINRLFWTGLGSFTTDVWVRMYVRISVLPVSAVQLILFQTSASANSGTIRIQTDGTIRAFNAAGTAMANGTSAMSVNTWYLLEGRHRASTTVGQQEFWLSNEFGTLIENKSGTGAVLGANCDQVAYGMNSSAVSSTIDMDAMEFTDIAKIGPYQDFPKAQQNQSSKLSSMRAAIW